MSDLDALFEAAKAVRENAYAPYSNFLVGAALRAPDGTVFIGCNVENASYPVSVCAEGGAVSAMIAAGYREIAEIMTASGDPMKHSAARNYFLAGILLRLLVIFYKL